MLDLNRTLQAMGATENTEVVFRPVRCTEKQLDGKEAIDGFVYFTTDTKKIYCGTGGEYLPMGGNSGIYYGTRTFSEDESGTQETDFAFTPNDIDGGVIPQLNDLILNSDGCFYRVVSVNELQCIGRRLTVAGGGGPAGPGGGTGGSSAPSIVTEYGNTPVYFNGNRPETMKLYFTPTSLVPENNFIKEIRYLIGTTEFIEDNVSYPFDSPVEIDLTKYSKQISTTNQNTLSIEVTDSYGSKSYKAFIYFNVINLAIETDSPAIVKVDKTENEGDFLTYYVVPKGGSTIKGKDKKYLKVRVTPINDLNTIVYETTIPVDKLNDDLPISINMQTITTPVHGVYYMSIIYEGIIDTPTGEIVIIESNTIEAQIIYFDKKENTTLIATNFIGGTTTQYNSYSMKYMIATDSDKTSDYVTIFVGDLEDKQEAILNAINTWEYTFITPGIFEISIRYDSGKQQLGSMSVLEYDGDVPNIDTSTDNTLELYLTALGKSNSQASKEEWTWVNPRNKEKYVTKFDKFLWGDENGWLKDGDEAFLRLTNGANIELTNYHPFASDATTDGLTIEIDFRLSGVLDYTKPLISCLSSTKDADGEPLIYTGFQITGQRSTLNSSDIQASITDIEGSEDAEGNVSEQDAALQAFTQYINENARIHLTYVIPRIPSNFKDGQYFFVYTYLDGVMSGMAKLNTSAANNTHESFTDGYGIPSTIKIDSSFGDIDIFNIRVYRRALSPRNVISNYIADISNIDDKIASNKDNDIFDSDGFIDLKSIQDLSYKLNVPYVLFKGGNPINKKPKDPFTHKAEYMIPQRKDDFRLMSVAMYDAKVSKETPVWNVPIELEDTNSGAVINSFNEMEVGANYKAKRGVQVYGQGTSSMIYPVKNLRLKTVKSSDFPTVKDSAPLEIVCFKTDFMDSSASHNTSTGNLVHELLTQMNLKSPAQQFAAENKGKDGATNHKLLTAIQGYPIICFYQAGDDDDNWTFIGRYNFNIDKATPEPFGFIPQKVYVETGSKDAEGNPIIKTVTDEQGRERKVVKVCGLKTETVNGETVLPLDEKGEEVERDIVQCWEILNNDNGTLTKFLTNGFPNFNQAFYSITSKGAHNWTGYYEDRYPDELKGIGEEGAKDVSGWPTYYEDLNNGIYRVAEWLNSTATGEITGKLLDTPKYYQTLDNNWIMDKQYYNADGTPFEVEVLTSASAIAAGFMDESEYLVQVTIDADKFIEKAQAEDFDFGIYSFLYGQTEDDPTGHWSLLLNGQVVHETVSLSDYGVAHGIAVPARDGHTINVTYEEYNTWNAGLYEYYTHDSAEYRLSKFKSEFTQYFNMDFSLFYYILTLVLLMMDSRAKNMMLASWDQTIWYPIFYDMDTMLGINNTGFNKFSYDIEDDPKDKVFNGWDSVLWNNFRTCFGREIYQFYGQMRNNGLDISTLLSTYNDSAANAWNEALITADAIYKYERPYREGYYNGKDKVQVGPGKKNYLYASQGRRSNHRAWWLGNRLPYFDSKYMPNTYGDNKPDPDTNFTFRAYAIPEQRNSTAAENCIEMVPPNHNFTFTALTNGYLSTFVGNTVYGPTYTTAGNKATLGPGAETRHEVESYILSPELISDLGDLSDKYLGQFTFPATKQLRLTSLRFGRSSRSHGPESLDDKGNLKVYYNKNGVQIPEAYSKYYNKLLTSVDVGDSCPYLTDINIARCIALSSVDFSKCSRLQVLDAEGCTNLTSVTFPANSILEKVYLPNNLTSLTLTNQPHLEVLELESTKKLQSITLDRVTKLDSYDLVKEIFESAPPKAFKLIEVNWTVDEYDEKHLVVDEESGKTYLSAIDILEMLKDDTRAYPLPGLTLAQALTGTLTVDIKREDIYIDEYAIYELYKTTFPNLTIQYSEDTKVDRAIDLRFMSGDEESIHYQVYGEINSTIGALITADGPNGKPLTDPTKPETDEYSYEFNYLWVDEKAPQYVYYDGTKIDHASANSLVKEIFQGQSKIVTNLRNVRLTVRSDGSYQYVFKPLFKSTDRLYLVQFYVDSEKVGETGVKYGQKYDFDNEEIKNFWYKEPSATMKFEERWAFQGWSQSNYGTQQNVANPSYVDLRDLEVRSLTRLYAHFKTEDCRKVASSAEYFKFENDIVSIKDEYRDVLKGKITIPSEYKAADKSVHSLTTIGKINSLSEVTHIFFLEDNISYTTISNNAFERCDKLVSVELPSNIQTIGNYAFQYNKVLEQCDLPEGIISLGTGAFTQCYELKTTKLPNALQTIGMGAFQGDSKITIAEIPKSVKTIGSSAFSYCAGITISKFGGSEHSLKEIHKDAFKEAGSQVITVQIGSSVEVIGPTAFSGYGGNKLTSVTFAKSGAYDYFKDADRLNRHEIPSDMGFSGVSVEWNIDI